MKSTFIAPEVGAYLSENCTRPSPLLLRLRAETIAKTGEYSKMQVTPEQGAFLTLLVKLTDARRAIEVGTFTGYSSLCIAAGLPEGGHLITCEGVREWAAIGQRYWARAGLRDRVELRLGVAIDTLRDLPKIECFDFAFIDADKISYLDYYEELLARVRPGGVMCVDNVLWNGQVADPDANDPETAALKEFNAAVLADPRVESVMIPIADGLTLCRKR